MMNTFPAGILFVSILDENGDIVQLRRITDFTDNSDGSYMLTLEDEEWEVLPGAGDDVVVFVCQPDPVRERR